MCFYVSNIHPNKKIANKNITCYKILCKGFISPYRGYEYKAHLLIKDKIGGIVGKSYGYYYAGFIHRGLHSFSSKNKAYRRIVEFFNPVLVVKCIIPKGSEYYYNEIKEEYVSNQLIMVSEVKKRN